MHSIILYIFLILTSWRRLSLQEVRPPRRGHCRRGALDHVVLADPMTISTCLGLHVVPCDPHVIVSFLALALIAALRGHLSDVVPPPTSLVGTLTLDHTLGA